MVEIEPALVGWMRDGTIPHGRRLPGRRAADAWSSPTSGQAVAEAGPATYDLVLLDVDNGPGYLVHDANAALYGEPFLASVRAAAAPRRRAGGLVGGAPPGAAARWRGVRQGRGRGRTTCGSQDRDEQYWLYLAATRSPTGSMSA